VHQLVVGAGVVRTLRVGPRYAVDTAVVEHSTFDLGTAAVDTHYALVVGKHYVVAVGTHYVVAVGTRYVVDHSIVAVRTVVVDTVAETVGFRTDVVAVSTVAMYSHEGLSLAVV
jgi:hypothetical protein